MAYHAYRYDHHVKKKARKRRYGGGRSVSVDFIIDGTERRVHRPKDATEQREKYSGKKKTIP